MDPPKKETCALLKYLLVRTKKSTGFGTRVIKNDQTFIFVRIVSLKAPVRHCMDQSSLYVGTLACDIWQCVC